MGSLVSAGHGIQQAVHRTPPARVLNIDHQLRLYSKRKEIGLRDKLIYFSRHSPAFLALKRLGWAPGPIMCQQDTEYPFVAFAISSAHTDYTHDHCSPRPPQYEYVPKKRRVVSGITLRHRVVLELLDDVRVVVGVSQNQTQTEAQTRSSFGVV